MVTLSLRYLEIALPETMRGDVSAGRSDPMLAQVMVSPVAVALCSLGNQSPENRVMLEKNTTPVTPIKKYAA